MIKVLWISIRLFSDEKEKQTAAWLKALAEILSSSHDVSLANISTDSQVAVVSNKDYHNVRQWAFPPFSKDKNGCPPKEICKQFDELIKQISPDIIQVWGSENPFGIYPFIRKSDIPVVMTMQGVLGSIADVMLSDLSFKERLSCIGIREIIKRRSIFSMARSFYTDGFVESRMILKCDHIITQSEWTESQIRAINKNAIFYRTHRRLRKDFLQSEKWFNFPHSKHIIYTGALGYPLKGTLSLLKALNIIKESYPDVELRIAGYTGRTDWLGSGYLRMLLKYLNKNKLTDNVKFLGAINSEQIVGQLQHANVFVNPSYIESYSQVLAEAMIVGTPGVVSFAGAMPELASNSEVLFYTPGDYRRCADLIMKLFADSDLSNVLSHRCVETATQREINFDILKEQIEIYEKILYNSSKNKKCNRK